MADKGLVNNRGENNCFLNVVIQSLWHLGLFRERFFEWTAHKCNRGANPHAPSCVHCALAWIFSYYSDPDTSLIPPKLLRQTLNNIFKEQNRFQIGAIDDAAEALEAVLNCLHDNTREEDGEASCVAHGIFGIDTLSILQCSNCKEQSEPAPNLHFLEYTYADHLRAQHKQSPDWSFEKLIQATNQEYKGCPKDDDKNPCKNVVNQVNRHLLNVPSVLAFGLVWSSSSPSLNDIMDTLEIIQQEVKLKDLFNVSEENQCKASYRFRGMICYYGKHYNAYFFNETISQWIVFDDATVKEVGATWDHVLRRCRLGHFHPSVLFYEKNISPQESEKVKIENPQIIEKPIAAAPIRKPEKVVPVVSQPQPVSLNQQLYEPTLVVPERRISGGIPPGYRIVQVNPFSMDGCPVLPGYRPVWFL